LTSPAIGVFGGLLAPAQRRRSGVSFARPITASSVTQGLSPVLYETGEPCRRRFVEKVVKSLKSGPRAKAFAPIVLIELRNIPGANFAYFRGWLFCGPGRQKPCCSVRGMVDQCST
jgi:hypothetical protein